MDAPVQALVAGAAGQIFARWMADHADRVEGALTARLPAVEAHPARLHEAIRYAVLGGGKRIRPMLVYGAGEFTGAAPGALDCAACAVEMIHAYSLVHDDMPCMDNDVLRRGKPTVHVAFGEAMAMLVGDALQALAFESLAAAAGLGASPTAVVAMVAELGRGAGSLGMVGGQAIDLAAVGRKLARAELEDMHRRKTGALLAASVRLGAACGRPLSGAERMQLDRFALAVGLAFQVVDDVLDVEADSATLGKTAGKDSEQNKPTYVSVLGLREARALAQSLRAEARSALAGLGPGASRLAAISDLIVQRSS